MNDLKEVKKNKKMAQFYRYWTEKCRDGRLPSRNDIDPTDIPAILPSMMLLDVERQAGGDIRFRVRLFGSEHVDFNGADLTGRYIDEILAPGDSEVVEEAYRSVIETHEPHYWHTHVRMVGCEHRHYNRLMLPLAGDGETVDMLVGVFEFGVRPKSKLYKSIPVAAPAY